jgi:membrane dipeptidase
MSPTEEEIRRIADTGGLIAVIFMNYWLGEHQSNHGLDAIVATIKRIITTGGIDVVGIGSDFDGFTDPPDDLEDISKMPKLTHALLAAGISETDVTKVLGLNLERVLRQGWC